MMCSFSGVYYPVINPRCCMQGITHLLRDVLDDGHELAEAEMELLFSARGADFHAVCNAAGARLCRAALAF